MPADLPLVEQIFTVDASRFLAGLDEMIERLDKAAESINEITDALARMDADIASGGINVLTDAFDRLVGALDENSAALDRNTGALGATDAALDRTVGALDLTVTALNESTAASDRAATAADGVAASYGRAAAAGEGSGGKLSKFGSTAKLALLGVGAGLVYGVVKAAEFQTSTTRLATSAGESYKNLDMVRQGLLNMAGQVGITAGDLAKGMYVVESAGDHGAAGLIVLKAAAQGAKDEGADLSVVANAVTDALTDYHLKVSDSADVTSKLVTAVSFGKTNFQDFSKALSNVLPLAGALHLKIGDVSGVLAEMTSHGLTAQRASQNEANAMRELAAPTATMSKELGLFGLTSEQVQGKLGSAGLSGTLDWLRGKADTMAKSVGQTPVEAFKKMLGSSAALTVGLMTTGENAGATAKAIKGIGSATADAHGNVQGFAEVQKTLAQQFADLKASAETLAIKLGTALMPVAMALLPVLGKVVTALGTALAPALSALAGPLASLTPVFSTLGGVIGKIATAAVPVLSNMIRAVLPAVSILGRMAGSVIPVLGSALLKLTPAFTAVANAVSTVLGALQGSGILTVFATAIAGLAGPVSQLVVTLVQGLTPILPPLVKALSQVVTVFTGGLLRAVTALMPALTSVIGILTQLLVKVIVPNLPALTRLDTALMNLLFALIPLIPPLTQLVVMFLQLALDVITPLLKLLPPLIGFLADLAAVIGFVISWVARIISAFLDWVTNFQRVSAASDKMRRGIQIAFDAVRHAVAELGHDVAVWFDRIRHDIARWMDDARHDVGKVVTFFKELPGKILQQAAKFGGLLVSAGKSLIDGLMHGIDSKVDELRTKVEGLGGDVVGWAKDALSIFSPSKKFYQLGAFITEGLANGITMTASKAEAAARSLAARVTAAYSSGQITGSEQAELLARVSTGLSARDTSSARTNAAIDTSKISAQITAMLGAGRIETMPAALKASRQLGAEITREVNKGIISQAEAERLDLKLTTELTARQDRLTKTMSKIGLEMGSALLTALETATSASAVKTIVSRLAGYIQQAYAAGDITRTTATSLTAFLQADNAKLQSLATQRANIEAQIKTADSYAASTTSSVESWASLSNAETLAGGTSGADIGAGMGMQLAQIQKLASDVQALAKRGLSRVLLNQIIQAGPADGLPLAESLLADTPGQISSLNNTESEIESYSTSLGQTAADLMYDSGAQAGKGFLSGLQAQEAAITAEMDKIALSMVATIKKALKIKSPSQVMADAGSDTAKGLVLGLAGGAQGVQAAARGLALAVTAGVGSPGTAGLRVAGSGAGGAGGGTTVIQPQITVSGYIGSEQQLGDHLFSLIQHASLQYNRRNPSNGLSLAGRS